MFISLKDKSFKLGFVPFQSKTEILAKAKNGTIPKKGMVINMNLSYFLQQNAMLVPNIQFLASERFLDDAGSPVLWEIKSITNTLNDELQKSCTKKVQDNRNTLIPELDRNLYLGKLAAECTVVPDLSDAALQDSYGVMGRDSLLKAMLTPGEYADYLIKVQEINGFNINFSEKVKTAKN